jgi:hypothetical protein
MPPMPHCPELQPLFLRPSFIGNCGIETAFRVLQMAKAAREKPWWLESGHEHCSACSHTYVYETGFYCASCDGQLCSFCVEDTITVLCLQCGSPDKEIKATSTQKS